MLDFVTIVIKNIQDMSFLHRSVRGHWVWHCKDTNAGKHFITRTVSCGGDGWISTTFLTSLVFLGMLVFFIQFSFANHVHKDYFIPPFIFYLFLQQNPMVWLCLLHSSDLFRDWDRWEAECLRSGLELLAWVFFFFLLFELHRFWWPWSGWTSFF